jgi:hypothetical protein
VLGGLLSRAAGRTLARPTPSTAIDAMQRGAHVLRHSRLGRRPEPADVFNLDLHIAVVADVGVALQRRRISLTSWSLSAHAWVFDRPVEPVAFVNERTLFSFGPRTVRRFQRAYGSFLESFRGYLATHTPCFALLYRGLGKPTLAVASTRYEWPFTRNAQLWGWLDDGLREGVAEGWLTLVANNRADADYVENYTGLRPAYIPSGCAYIAPTYTGRLRPAVVAAASERLAAAICQELEQDCVPLRALGRRHTWAQLYDHRAIVLIPYNVSTMSLFEHYSACAPVYVPDRSFLKRLMATYPREVLSSLSFSQAVGQPAKRGVRDLNDLRDADVLDWYLDRADFYDAEWMPHVRLFESWSHLDHLLATDDHVSISSRMAAEKAERLRRIAALWDELEWLDAIAPRS